MKNKEFTQKDADELDNLNAMSKSTRWPMLQE